MRHEPLPFDVEGPVRAEVFVVALRDGSPVLSGPCGAEPWLIEAGGEEHPVATVERLAKAAVDPVHVSHSTSWRHNAGAVVLSFVVVTDADALKALARDAQGRPCPWQGLGG